MQVQIVDFPNYIVTDEGQILRGNHVIAPTSRKLGYPQVCLIKDGKKYNVYIHQIVAKAFVPNPDNKPQVNHIDGVKDHNYPSNLEWVTHSENLLHAYRNGLRSKQCKIDMIKASKIRDLYKSGNYNFRQLADSFGVSSNTISRVIHNEAWR